MGSGDGRSRPIALPALLTISEAIPLVARRDAWRVLDETWTAAADGARQLVLVPGDAGAGKTRLLTEFARSVHGTGASVLYGGCSEEQTVPYQPFAEALDHLVGAVEPDTAATRLGAFASELARLVPHRVGELGMPEPAGHGDPDAERTRLFRAVVDAIARFARDQPLLIVLDDLHWARRPTVELLGHVMRDATLRNVMILGSYRSEPAEASEALRTVLPDLRRLPGVTRLPLSPLDRGGVEDFVAAAAGHPVGPELRAAAELLVRQTDGNAFLLVELWLHLVETGYVERRDDRWAVAGRLDDVGSPEGVREVVAARLARLDVPVRELLEIASVIGTMFEPSVLAGAAGTSVVAALSTLDVAVRARIVGDDGAGTFRFSHELIRRSIYEGLGGTTRRRHHLAIARALGHGGGAAADGTTGDVARHLIAAVPLVDASDAVAAAVRAADAAAAVVAYDDAATLLGAALAIAPERSVDLMLRHANVTMRAGDVVAAKAGCLAAHRLAVRTGDVQQRIAAALAYGEATWRDARDGATAARLLRDALQLVDDAVTRVRVQAALTRALAVAGDGETAWLLGEDALESARTLDDRGALRSAFDAVSYAPWTPATLPRQLAVARESASEARARDDREWEGLSVSKSLYGEITAGEITAARSTAARQRQLAAEVGEPLFQALNRQAETLLAVGEGRLAEAEALAIDAEELAKNLSSAPAGGFGVQMFTIRRAQGRLDEARPVVEAVARLGNATAAWRPALAVMYAELGLLDEAEAEVDVLTAHGLAAVPRDSLWVGSLSYLADACRILGHREGAAAVYAELVPWRGLVVQVGYLLAAHGSVDRYLGDLAALLGWEQEAEIHFRAAVQLDGAAAMPVWLAHSQLAFGRFLAGRHRGDDHERAAVLLEDAAVTAELLGLLGAATEARAVLAATSDDRTSSRLDGLTEREVAVVGLVAQGCSNREIGARLHISQHTAANHVRSILMKTACANRTEAAAWALQRGLTHRR